MSLRQFIHELRPLFHMLDEPVSRSFAARSSSLLGDPSYEGLHLSRNLRPVIELSEDDSNYLVEAELPGVQRENLDISVGDGGRSVTIEGKIFRPSQHTVSSEQAESKNLAETHESNVPSSETRSTQESVFRKTFWLPHPVDGSNVVATLKDGLLNMNIPKAEKADSVKVHVN